MSSRLVGRAAAVGLVAAVALAASFVVVARSAPVAARTAADLLQVETGEALGRVEMLHPRGWKGEDQPAEARPSRTVNGGVGIAAAVPQYGIQYNGGPVILSAKVVSVYWATTPIFTGGPAPGTTGSGAADGSLIGHFLRNLGGSQHYNINTSYTDGAGTPIQNNVSYSGFWANAHNAPTGTASVSNTQMQNELIYGFNNGLITYDANTIYAIFSSGQVNLGGGFGGANFQYCAFHTYFTWNGKIVKYAAMPYNYAYPSACSMFQGGGPANGDAGADAEVNTLTHEIEEANTDPQLNAWWVTDSASAHYNQENADMCAWTFGTLNPDGKGNITVGGKSFLVQRNWLNTAPSGGCAQTYGSAPATGTLAGRVTNSAGGAAIAGATVSIAGGGSTTTDANGNYTIANTATGSNRSVTASKSGFNSATVNTVTITAGATTTQNFSLTATSPTTGTLTGTVTQAAGGAALAGATVSIAGGGSATTDSLGAYTIANVAPGSNLSVTASASGFTSSTVSGVAVTAGSTTTRNFALVASSPTASAPGAPALSASGRGFSHGINLSWSVPANNGSAITGYRIYRSTASAGTYTQIASVGAVTTYTDTGNPGFRTSYYKVVAVNGVGAGPFSNVASAFSF